MFTDTPTMPPAGVLARLKAFATDRRRTPAQRAYDAALDDCEVTFTELQRPHDAWMRMLHLLRSVAAHDAAAMLATELPLRPDVPPHHPLTVAEMHRSAATMLDYVAVTERNVAVGDHFDGLPLSRPRVPLNPRWADTLAQLSAEPNLRTRAALVLRLGLITDRGGPVAGVLYQVARAYLEILDADGAGHDLVVLYQHTANAVTGARDDERPSQ